MLALLAGLILFVQTSLTTAGAGEMLDAFGNPLCISRTASADKPDHPSPASEHKPGSNCCVLGCGTAGPFAPTPYGETAALARSTDSAMLPVPVGTEANGPETAHDPANPRAPPGAV